MNEQIRFALLRLHIFDPCSNSGLSIDGLVLSSKELEKVPMEAISAELQSMESDGFVELSLGDYWQSTLKGQTLKQKLIASSGGRSEAFIKQKNYQLKDLVLALLASHKSSNNFRDMITKKEKLPIYLYEFDEKEIYEALSELTKDGYLSDEWTDIAFYSCPILTGKGLQYYHNEIHSRLGLVEGQSILDPLPQTEIADERFLKLPFEEKLIENLLLRWNEAKKCYEAKASLACLVMLGSILEGLLLSALSMNIQKAMRSSLAPKDRKTSKTKELREWKLQDMINVSVDLGIVSKGVSKHSHELRDSRNLIHPNKQIEEDFEVDEGLLNISFEVVNAVVESLIESHK